MTLKVKVSSILNPEDLAKVKARNILKAQSFYDSCPFSTKVYMALKTKLPMSFIQDNWDEITKNV